MTKEDRKGTYGWSRDVGVPLLDKIKEDLKEAMRNRDNEVRDAIRVVMGEFPKLTVPLTLESGKKTFRVKKHEEITDDDLLTIIQGLVKSEKSVLELQELKSSPFLSHLETYLPKMAGREEITAWIRANIDLAEYKSPMQAMGTIMKHFGKQADGKMVQAILGEMTG